MIEFSEDFSKRITGNSAVAQRVAYRLTPRVGDIPYFQGGLDAQEFTYADDLLGSLRYLLADFHTNVSVTSDGRVTVGNVTVAIPGGMN